MKIETNFTGVFDSPLSDYERVFRPLLGDLGFQDTLATVPATNRPLVLDLMTSGVNLVNLGDVASCLAVGLQRPRAMTVEDLAAHDVTYIHSDITGGGTWQDVDGWLEGRSFSLAMARPEGAYYSLFWDFDHYWEQLVCPTLERLSPWGCLFFQTPFRAYIPEGKVRWRLNTTFRTDEIERLETMVLGLNGSGCEAHLGVADFDMELRPYFDLLLMVRKLI